MLFRSIVLPEEVDGLSITQGEDYVTLVTCTPYGINSHRMLIRGTRIPYDGNYDADVETKPAPENSDVPKEEQGNGFTTKQWIWFGVAAFGAAIGAGLLLPGKKSEKPGKPRKKDSGKKDSESSRTEKKEGSHEKEN